MTKRDERVDSLPDRTAVVFELDAHEPTDDRSPDQIEPDRAAAVVINSWDGGTMVVEAGIDNRGQGFVLASGFGSDGEPIPPIVLDAGDSVMVQLDTSVRQE